ncbi:hypothetical protein Poli38472_013503 [Pythium oligandrum]|uniref:Helicase C-terminal domain-containing protein n=1 Tax=Pythium oligandrum TaxID=41045 RepID=A0A8K1C7G5_PYTOL|nr:hypothetical protein Poli38472_013503 [Pythium oligandrum]|eukprot:TMW58029.1 hypothetical protein Poli38472_013503 [Pythium oligandrum]
MAPPRKSPVKQVSIESFIGSEEGRVKEDVQFKVPFLPLNAPVTPTPDAFNPDVPLFAHQQRSLYRMLQIESRDEHVSKFNFGVLDYYSKGGCLADAIGTGKTATMLALIVSEPINATLGGNLLIAPSHLLAQWKMEVDKFVKEGEIDVVLGLRRYLTMDSAEISNRTLVLVGVEEAVASQAHYYHYRKLYPRDIRTAGKPMSVDVDAMHEYTEAAKYVSKAYSGLVWTTKLHHPEKPWRRVVFEEVQDLVLPGKESQDCFIQLTRSCEHVWLITATPFPAKADSIYANNQLLGFKRLRLMAHDPVFDEIKKKLYLRNCAQVKQEAITSKIRVKETYISVKLHPRELLLCKVEQVLAASSVGVNVMRQLGDDGFVDPSENRSAVVDVVDVSDEKDSSSSTYWQEKFTSARQSCVHIGISDRVLEKTQGNRRGPAAALPASVPIKTPNEVYKHQRYFLDRQLAVTNMHKGEVDEMEVATRNTVAILKTIMNNVYWGVAECFEDMETSKLDEFFDDSGETKKGFRMLSRHGKWVNHAPPEPKDLIMYYVDEIEGYLRKYFTNKAEIERLCSVMETNLNERCPRARTLVEDQLQQIQECIKLKEELEQKESRVPSDDKSFKIPTHGSKITNLILYLQRLEQIRVVVFTMWPNALRVVEQALRQSGISSAVFLQHQSSETKSAHVQAFLRGETQVLLLNSLTSASGINLQIASHVIFLDPVGYSATQASTLEQQAIGRVLRMGQTNSEVSVVRLVAEQTIEATLYDEIHAANRKVAEAEASFFDGERSGDDAYVCLDFAEPIRRVVRMEVRPGSRPSAETLGITRPEDEEIAMVGAMSLEQVINNRIESAVAQGEVFDLTEDAEESLDAQLAAARRRRGAAESNDGLRPKRRRVQDSGDVIYVDDGRQATVKPEPVSVKAES